MTLAQIIARDILAQQLVAFPHLSRGWIMANNRRLERTSLDPRYITVLRELRLAYVRHWRR